MSDKFEYQENFTITDELFSKCKEFIDPEEYNKVRGKIFQDKDQFWEVAKKLGIPSDLENEIIEIAKLDYQVKRIWAMQDLVREFMSLRENGFWSFRGQRNHNWELGIHDIYENLILTKNSLRKLEKKVSGKISEQLKKLENIEYPSKYKFEKSLEAFIDKQDLDNVKSIIVEYAAEGHLELCLEQFKKRCMEFDRPEYLDEDKAWRWIFYAHHYRLKTRLLDSSSNPLVALYFAVETILAKKVDDNTYGAVWALNVEPNKFIPSKILESKTIDRISDETNQWIMINPDPITSRLVRQSGKFSYHPADNPEQISRQKRRGNEKLVKIIIGPEIQNQDNCIARQLRNELGIMNIHHASLFPDPEGVAQFINNEWPTIALDLRGFE